MRSTQLGGAPRDICGWIHHTWYERLLLARSIMSNPKESRGRGTRLTNDGTIIKMAVYWKKRGWTWVFGLTNKIICTDIPGTPFYKRGFSRGGLTPDGGPAHARNGHERTNTGKTRPHKSELRALLIYQVFSFGVKKVWQQVLLVP